MVDQSEQTDPMIGTVIFDDHEGTVMYECSRCEDPIMIEDVDDGYEIESNPCETCGSHGTWKIETECDCGNTHNIVIKDW